YADGGFSGGNMERPALQGLLADIRAGRIDILVIYKADRLTQSLANFARLVEIFDAQDATFVPLRSSSIRRARCGAPHAQFAAHHFPPNEVQTAYCVSRRQSGGMSDQAPRARLNTRQRRKTNQQRGNTQCQRRDRKST